MPRRVVVRASHPRAVPRAGRGAPARRLAPSVLPRRERRPDPLRVAVISAASRTRCRPRSGVPPTGRLRGVMGLLHTPVDAWPGFVSAHAVAVPSRRRRNRWRAAGLHLRLCRQRGLEARDREGRLRVLWQPRARAASVPNAALRDLRRRAARRSPAWLRSSSRDAPECRRDAQARGSGRSRACSRRERSRRRQRSTPARCFPAAGDATRWLPH